MTAGEKRILIVDDDGDFAEALSSFLEANRFTVVRARDGEEAVKLAKLERPDLILMDIMMNERTEGFFAIQEMRHAADLKDVPIFVLTSLYEQVPDFKTAPDSAWSAYDEFLPKPVDMGSLLDKIRQRLGAAGG